MEKTNGAAPQAPQPGGDIKGEREMPTSTPDITKESMAVSQALGLAWQLALAVIVPIVGGYILDQHYHKAPWLTLCGLFVAAVGVFGILSKVIIEAGHGGNSGTPGSAA